VSWLKKYVPRECFAPKDGRTVLALKGDNLPEETGFPVKFYQCIQGSGENLTVIIKNSLQKREKFFVFLVIKIKEFNRFFGWKIRF